MSKPWEEEAWDHDGGTIFTAKIRLFTASATGQDRHRIDLATAAPNLYRALEALSHLDRNDGDYCAGCDYSNVSKKGHGVCCPIERALSFARGEGKR